MSAIHPIVLRAQATFTLGILASGLAMFALPSRVAAQSKKHHVQVDILIEPGPTAQLRARDWAAVFQKVGYNPTFRQGRPGEKTTIEDIAVRNEKVVKVIGLLDRNGAIDFRGQHFSKNQELPLKAWLDKLAEFGAKGPANEHPTWGLSEEQYTEVLKLLGKPTVGDVDLSSPIKAIDSVGLSTVFEFRFTAAAAKKAAVRAEFIADSKPDLRQFSQGTALSLAMAHFGLGFRPIQGQNGKYIIEVDSGSETANMYPAGWKNKLPITTLVPAISKSIPVDLEDAQLDALIQLLAGRLKLPLVYSSYVMKTDGKDVSNIKYTRKPDKISPYALMRIMGKVHKLGFSIRTDEAGKVFLWVTTEADHQAFQKRFR